MTIDDRIEAKRKELLTLKEQFIAIGEHDLQALYYKMKEIQRCMAQLENLSTIGIND